MEYLEETILDNKFLLTPSCFFQVNRDSCQILYKRVIDYINIKEGIKKLYIRFMLRHRYHKYLCI